MSILSSSGALSSGLLRRGVPVELFAVEGEIARVHPEPALAVDPGRGPTRLVRGRRAHQPANVTGIVRGGVHSRMQEKWAQAPPRAEGRLDRDHAANEVWPSRR